jgi:hypothetical protein
VVAGGVVFEKPKEKFKFPTDFPPNSVALAGVCICGLWTRTRLRTNNKRC